MWRTVRLVAWLLYCAAAAKNHPGAQYALGWMYFNGRGVERDDALAAAWFRKAAKAGDAVEVVTAKTVFYAESGGQEQGRTGQRHHRGLAQGGPQGLGLHVHFRAPWPTTLEQCSDIPCSIASASCSLSRRSKDLPINRSWMSWQRQDP